MNILAVGRLSSSMFCSGCRSGIPVASTARGADAVERLNSEQCDVIVCDLDLPDMPYEELRRSVQTRYPCVAFVLCVEPDKLREAILGMFDGAAGFITPCQTLSNVPRGLATARMGHSLSALLLDRSKPEAPAWTSNAV